MCHCLHLSILLPHRGFDLAWGWHKILNGILVPLTMWMAGWHIVRFYGRILLIATNFLNFSCTQIFYQKLEAVSSWSGFQVPLTSRQKNQQFAVLLSYHSAKRHALIHTHYGAELLHKVQMKI